MLLIVCVECGFPHQLPWGVIDDKAYIFIDNHVEVDITYQCQYCKELTKKTIRGGSIGNND